MSAEQHVKLFRHGASQAVSIPAEFELPGEDAIMWKEGDRLIIEAAPRTEKPAEDGLPTIEELERMPMDL